MNVSIPQIFLFLIFFSFDILCFITLIMTSIMILVRTNHLFSGLSHSPNELMINCTPQSKKKTQSSPPPLTQCPITPGKIEMPITEWKQRHPVKSTLTLTRRDERGSTGCMPRTVDALGDLQQPVGRLAVEELAEQRHPASGARSVRRARNATL
jgi:hypothetical protein